MMQRKARAILVKVPCRRCSNCGTVMPWTPKPPRRCANRKCGAVFHPAKHLSRRSKIGLPWDGKE
jgi:hypothetical protein